MTQTIDKTNSQGNWKPKRYARVFASDQEEITEAADGGVFGTKYFAVWCKLNFAGFNSNDIYFQESLFNISKATGLDKKTIRKAISFLESRRFIEVKKGERNSAGLNESSYFKLLRNVPKKAEIKKNTDIKPEGKNSEKFPLEPEGKNESLHGDEISPVFNSSSNEESIVEKLSPLKQKSFKTYSLEDFKNEIANSAKEKGMPESMMTAFMDYWSEKSPSGKMKFQLQETWESSRRLDTWLRNQEKFEGKKTGKFAEGQIYHQEGGISKWKPL